MLKYRENSYFNDIDYFIFRNNLNQISINRAELYNGNWYSNNYKLTSVESINFSEIYHKEIILKNGVKGVVVKVMKNSLGIIYNQGQNFKKTGLPSFWQEINQLNII